jgi:hypothetical protein
MLLDKPGHKVPQGQPASRVRGGAPAAPSPPHGARGSASPQAPVQLIGDRGQVLRGVPGQGGALGKVLAQQPVGVRQRVGGRKGQRRAPASRRRLHSLTWIDVLRLAVGPTPHTMRRTIARPHRSALRTVGHSNRRQWLLPPPSASTTWGLPACTRLGRFRLSCSRS